MWNTHAKSPQGIQISIKSCAIFICTVKRRLQISPIKLHYVCCFLVGDIYIFPSFTVILAVIWKEVVVEIKNKINRLTARGESYRIKGKILKACVQSVLTYETEI